MKLWVLQKGVEGNGGGELVSCRSRGIEESRSRSRSRSSKQEQEQ
jgi:hypothetical protein